MIFFHFEKQFIEGCVVDQWCPIENDESNNTVLHKLIGASHQRILINAQMNFPWLAPEKTFSTFKQNKVIEYPTNGANAYKVQ